MTWHSANGLLSAASIFVLLLSEKPDSPVNEERHVAHSFSRRDSDSRPNTGADRGRLDGTGSLVEGGSTTYYIAIDSGPDVAAERKNADEARKRLRMYREKKAFQDEGRPNKIPAEARIAPSRLTNLIIA